MVYRLLRKSKRTVCEIQKKLSSTLGVVWGSKVKVYAKLQVGETLTKLCIGTLCPQKGNKLSGYTAPRFKYRSSLDLDCFQRKGPKLAKRNDHAGDRTQNLLIRSQTPCHWATRPHSLMTNEMQDGFAKVGHGLFRG